MEELNTTPNSFTSADILLAVQNMLVQGTGLDPSKVAIRHDPNRVQSIQENHITLRMEGHNAITYGGAGRLGFQVERNLVVFAFVRSYVDEAGYDALALTDPSIGLYNFEDQILDTMINRPVLTITAPKVKMTLEPLYFLPGASPAQIPTPDPGWYQSFFLFKIIYYQKLSLSQSLGDYTSGQYTAPIYTYP